MFAKILARLDEQDRLSAQTREDVLKEFENLKGQVGSMESRTKSLEEHRSRAIGIAIGLSTMISVIAWAIETVAHAK